MGKTVAKVDEGYFRQIFSAAGLTAGEVAKRVGMDDTALSRALHGERHFKAGELHKIAIECGVPFNKVVMHVPGLDFLQSNESTQVGRMKAVASSRGAESVFAHVCHAPLRPAGLGDIGPVCLIVLLDGTRYLGMLQCAFGGDEFDAAPLGGSAARVKVAKVGVLTSTALVEM